MELKVWIAGNKLVKACFHGARKRFAKVANVEKLHSHFRLQKFAKYARWFGNVAIMLTGVDFNSPGISKKFWNYFAKRFPHPRPWFACDWSSKMYAHNIVTTCMMFAKSLWNPKQIPSVWRMFRACLAKAAKFVRSFLDRFPNCSRTSVNLLTVRAQLICECHKYSRTLCELHTNQNRRFRAWPRCCSHFSRVFFRVCVLAIARQCYMYTKFAYMLWELRTSCARMVYGSIVATHSEKNSMFKEFAIFSTFASFANRLCAPWKHTFNTVAAEVTVIDDAL